MSSHSIGEFDVGVVGGGVAGATAALVAARLGCSVALIHGRESTHEPARKNWIGPVGISLLTETGLTAPALQAADFSGMRLFSADFKRMCSVDDAELTGWIVDPMMLTRELQRCADDTKQVTRVSGNVVEIMQSERHRSLRCDDDTALAARILIIADGAESPASTLAGVGRGTVSTAKMVVASLGAHCGKPGISVVLGAGEQQTATILSDDSCAYVCIPVREPTAAAHSQLQDFCKSAAEAGVAPKAAPSDVQIIPCVAGMALDREAHVGKGCAIVGAAGGFAAAFSNEEIYPAMKSGRIVAEVAARALKATVPQDELATFSSVWRSELADYLRMPNTDLNLLLPLVFGNPQMSRRVARAFLLGQKF